MNFEKVLKEDYYDTFKYKSSYSNESKLVEVWKNPTGKEFNTIMKDKSFTRGVLLSRGDLYLTNNDDVIHEDILKILSKDGLLKFEKFWNDDDQHLEKYMCVHIELTKKIYPAESYRQGPYDLIEEKYLDVYSKALEKKNKMFKMGLR